MTDFLSGLLDRALNRAPVLEWRRPSRFEPAPTAGRLGFGRLDHSLDRNGEGIVSDSQSDPLAHTAELQASLQSRTSVPAAESSSVESVRLSDASVKASPLTMGLNRKARVAGIPSPPDRETPNESPAVLPARRIETVVLREIQRHESSAVNSTPSGSLAGKAPEPRVLTPSASEAPARPAPLIRADPGPQTKPRRDAADTNRMELVSAGRSRAATLPVLTPASRPVQTPASSRAEVARETEPALPVIQITIGRIEVRATVPAVAPPRSAGRKASALSLDDYLRSRSGRTK